MSSFGPPCIHYNVFDINVLIFLFIKCVCCDFKYLKNYYLFLLSVCCVLLCGETKMYVYKLTATEHYEY